MGSWWRGRPRAWGARVPLTQHYALALPGALAVVALASTAALAVFCFVKVVGLVLLGRPRRHATEAAVEAALPMRIGVATLAGACLVLGIAPGLLFGALVGLAPWGAAAPVHVGLPLPGT